MLNACDHWEHSVYRRAASVLYWSLHHRHNHASYNGRIFCVDTNRCHHTTHQRISRQRKQNRQIVAIVDRHSNNSKETSNHSFIFTRQKIIRLKKQNIRLVQALLLIFLNCFILTNTQWAFENVFSSKNEVFSENPENNAKS